MGNSLQDANTMVGCNALDAVQRKSQAKNLLSGQLKGGSTELTAAIRQPAQRKIIRSLKCGVACEAEPARGGIVQL